MYPDDDTYNFGLYRVCWHEEGKTNKSHGMYVRNAHNRMRLLLSKGIPAWLEDIKSDFDDDDIPF